MALQLPKFGNWEDDVPYTAYFEKAKKVRKTNMSTQVPEHSFHAREEVEDTNSESTCKIHNDQDSSSTEQKSRVSREEIDHLKKSTDSPKRISGQSVGSDKSSDNSQMYSYHRTVNKGSVSSEGSHGTTSSTAGKSRLRQVIRGDETPDDGPAIPKFGEWDDHDPRSGERYTEVFNQVRADKHGAGGKSPIITTENAKFYGQRRENPKGCGCFPRSRK